MVDDVPANSGGWMHLSPHLANVTSRRRLFTLVDELVVEFGRTGNDGVARVLKASADHRRDWPARDRDAINAAVHLAADLIRQGWEFEVGLDGIRCRRHPEVTPDEQRNARRRQLSLRRDEQLREASTRKFIRSVEHPRMTSRGRHSIFDLMCDGDELASSLERARDDASYMPLVPYLEVAAADSVCEHTGLPLQDVWRYFRHSWANAYDSIPGRSLQVLVRDASRPCHPVVGIVALGSPAIKVRCRDEFIGWDEQTIVNDITAAPSSRRWARWMREFLRAKYAEIYQRDLIRDDLLPPGGLSACDEGVSLALRTESTRSREIHQATIDTAEFAKGTAAEAMTDADWERQAKTWLYRSKRALRLANVIDLASSLSMASGSQALSRRLEAIVDDSQLRRNIGKLVRLIRSDTVGTEIADIVVCGAVPPYSEILGGKLVAMLAASGAMVQCYRQRYSGIPSVIASSMAGCKAARAAELVFLGTTSLYGLRPSQYDRAAYPCELVGGPVGERVRFRFLERTRGFGTSQISDGTQRALQEFMIKSVGRNWRANNVFGEGANPRMRALREAIDHLGLPAEELLLHGQTKCVYGVTLAGNAREYLLRLEARPEYLFDLRSTPRQPEIIARYWFDRWVRPRLDTDGFVDRVRSHSTTRPVRHGARVDLPAEDPGQIPLFADLL